MELSGKTVVITGATGGIGREIVKNLDDEGARIIAVSKSESELQNLLKNLKNKDNKYFVSDFTNQKEIQKTAQEISKEFKTVDVLINASGIGIYKAIEEATLDEWNKTMDINVSSVFIFIKELVTSLSNIDNSIVINLGSGMGITGVAGRSLYCTSKFALRGLTLSLADEYKRLKKPEFVLLTLGSVLTSFGPMSFEEKKRDMENGKGYLTPSWVAEKVVEIIKLEKREIEYEFSSPDYNKA